MVRALRNGFAMICHLHPFAVCRTDLSVQYFFTCHLYTVLLTYTLWACRYIQNSGKTCKM